MYGSHDRPSFNIHFLYRVAEINISYEAVCNKLPSRTFLLNHVLIYTGGIEAQSRTSSNFLKANESALYVKHNNSCQQTIKKNSVPRIPAPACTEHKVTVGKYVVYSTMEMYHLKIES